MPCRQPVIHRTERVNVRLYPALSDIRSGKRVNPMKHLKLKAGLLTLALLLTGAASADSNFGIGVKAGTLGIGIEGRWQPLPYVDFRLGTNVYEYEDNGDQADINYDGILTLDTVYLTANFHFPASPFRVSAGAAANGNEVLLVSGVNDSYNIGGIEYPADAVGELTSVTSFSSTSPYLGIGYDFELFGKAGLNFDLGVLWQGDPVVTLEATGLAVGDPIFDAALELERQQLEDEMSNLKAWPVVSLSFVYNF
jgi:hypothetical protein